MRISLLSVAICMTLYIGCKSNKNGLTSEEISYVRTTLDLMRTRANIKPGMDSILIKSMLDTVYRRHHTSRSDYLNRTGHLGDDPKRAEVVYNAIKDSVGVK